MRLPDVALDRLEPASITGSGAHAVILSVACELEGGNATNFAAAAEDLISVRAEAGPHLIWFTASTVDPEGGDAYRTVGALFLRALRLDADLVRLSRSRGVALIDARPARRRARRARTTWWRRSATRRRHRGTRRGGSASSTTSGSSSRARW